MKKTLCPAIFLATCLFSTIANSQTITINESSKENADYLHEFFKPVPNRYIAVNYASAPDPVYLNRNTRHTRITCYDSSMNEIYTGPVDVLSRNKYLGGFEIDQKLHIVYADKNKIFKCELNESTGQANGPSNQIAKTEAKPDALVKGFSPDGNYCFAMFTYKENDIMEGVVMDKQLNVVTSFSFRPEKSRIENTVCVLSSEGILSVVFCKKVKARKKNYRPLEYIIKEIGKDGKVTTTTINDLPVGRVDHIVWRAEKSGLAFTGLLSKSEEERFETIISGIYNSSQNKTTELKQSSISTAPYWQKVTGKYFSEYKTGIENGKQLIGSINGNDGSVTLVLQTTKITTQQFNNHFHTFSTTRDAVVLKINADHQLDWLQFVKFSQFEQSYPQFSGVMLSSPNNKDIFLFFHDHQNNFNLSPDADFSGVNLTDPWDKVNELAVVHITEDGTLTRKSAGLKSTRISHLAPREPYFVTGNEIIYTLYTQRNLGRSIYKPGIIKISLP